MPDSGEYDQSAARDPEVGAPLPLSFYLQDTLCVARLLLGKHLVRSGRGPRLVLRIVETEAYPPHDPASHAAGGPRGRAEVMFERGGIAYVYLIYGMHHCFNVVTGPGGRGRPC